jgi:hypothetical protein
MKPRHTFAFILLLPVFIQLLSGCSTQNALRTADQAALDIVQAGEFDTGKMWTFENPPIEYFTKTYGFTPSSDWFEHARLATVRIPGCTASFVSEDGLIVTNHHCAEGSVSKVNRDGENLLETGFYARTREEERRIPDYRAEVLALIRDVTAEVRQAYDSGTSDAEKTERRKQIVADIEKRLKDSTGLVCNVVSLYSGDRYSLYGYKRYDDVRLAFAPENSIGFFGGDYDNFTYPRYNLDVAFYRVYDDSGKPLKSEKYFRWSAHGASEGEAVFVVGNPGRTSRLRTIAQLEYNRDVVYPYNLGVRENLVKIYTRYLEQHPEKKVKLLPRLLGLTNSQKVFTGELNGLRDPNLMARKRKYEGSFVSAVLADPKLRPRYHSVWDEIASIQKKKAAIYAENSALTFRGTGRSRLFSIASDLVDYARQMQMPEGKRESKYKGTDLEKTKSSIFPTEFDPGLDKAILAYQLRSMQSMLRDEDATLNILLAGRSPEETAEELTTSCLINSKEKVDSLVSGPPDGILASTDPFITFVMATEKRSKELRAKNQELTAQEDARAQLLGKAIYDLRGPSVPPDATFTLRINDGVVKGFEYNGTIAPAFTTFYGLYDRYYSFNKKQPWSLPEAWKNPPPSFDLTTPFDFVTTNDIIGGNSGSPILNKNLEIVGIAFDGNMESLPGDFIYSEEKNRCVGVHSSAIIEALGKIYKADRIVKELK